MKHILILLALVASLVAAESIPTSGLYVDLYGNVFKDGQNLNRKAGDYVREFPAEAPAMDAALTEVALRGRQYIAAQVQAAQAAAAGQIAAKETEKQSAIASANAAIAANADELAAKTAALAAATARVAALEAHLLELATYIGGLRGTIAGLGGSSASPPTLPAP